MGLLAGQVCGVSGGLVPAGEASYMTTPPTSPLKTMALLSSLSSLLLLLLLLFGASTKPSLATSILPTSCKESEQRRPQRRHASVATWQGCQKNDPDKI